MNDKYFYDQQMNIEYEHHEVINVPRIIKEYPAKRPDRLSN